MRARLAIFVALLLVALTRPAGAEDLQHKHADTTKKQADVTRQLNLARLSDGKVEAEVQRLSHAVDVQQAHVQSALQAQAAAEATQAQANQQIEEINQRAGALRAEVVARAVRSYMHPEASLLEGLLKSRSLTEASRRLAFLDHVQGASNSLLDQYKGLRSDLAAAKSKLDAATAEAARRAREEGQAKDRLQVAEAQQQAAHNELSNRIADLQRESAQLAAEDGKIQALLRSQAAANAATLARTPGVKSLSGFIWPIHGPVTSEYGPRWGGFHPGIDIGMDTGTPIAAAKRGVVSFAGWNDGGYGNFVIIDHGDGTATAYAHQSRIGCSVGQVVSQGQTIGSVGSTGNSTGPHLHFEIRVNGVAQNPRNFESGSP
jgi:murein DD-endopeptidase MepM/ murein hydrolase activator NlpD